MKKCHIYVPGLEKLCMIIQVMVQPLSSCIV